MRALALLAVVLACGNDANPDREKALARLRSGPFDEKFDVDEIVDFFEHQGHDHASSLLANKFLRVKGRYYDATYDKDGKLIVVVGGWRGNDQALFCGYIGEDALVHGIHRNQVIVMHAIGAVDVKGVIGLGSCVIEPP